MQLKKFLVFGLVAAVLPAFAEEAADRKTATSLKYVEHELDTRQNKFGADNNKAMEYTNAAGVVQKRAVTSNLGTSTTDTSLPMVGGVNTKLDLKQDDIAAFNDHTAVTYTGTAGTIGAKGIYQATESYVEQSNNLIDAKTFNAALKRGLDSEFLCSEYKPGTDLCWVWSIHNTEPVSVNLFDMSLIPNTQYIVHNADGSITVTTIVGDAARSTGKTLLQLAPRLQVGKTYTLLINTTGNDNFIYLSSPFRDLWYNNTNKSITQDMLNSKVSLYANGQNTTATIYDIQITEVNPEMPFTTLVPAGYTPVEFIESNGTQYIDTDIKGHMNYTYELDFQQKDTNNYRNWGVFNQSTWQGQNMSFTWSSGWAVRWASAINGTNIVDLGRIDTNRHTLRIVDGEIYFDGVDRGRSTGHDSSFVFNYNLFLGTINPGGTTPSGNAKSKYYSYRVWDANGNLIQNFVPARQDSDNKVGMYDTVSGRFFPSVPANTNFAAGPDVNNIIYVPQNQ